RRSHHDNRYIQVLTDKRHVVVYRHRGCRQCDNESDRGKCSATRTMIGGRVFAMDIQRMPSTVGELLRRHRLHAGITQRELADRAGVSVRTLRDIELGQVVSPRAPSIFRLALALGLTEADRGALLAAVQARVADPGPARLWIGVLGPLVVRRGQTVAESPRRLDLRSAQVGQAADSSRRLDLRSAQVEQVAESPRRLDLRSAQVEQVEIESAMQRTLLGLLAVQPHEAVSRDEIVDVLWGERPPKTCLSLVHAYIGQLRATLE